jgi:hypothetical protein
MAHQVFISYSSKDAEAATRICHGLETRHIACWMSSRDVAPGADFQESIIEALEQAQVMVLVFSTNANNSSEMKKELVIAGDYKLPVLPVRIEKVLPTGAFRYQLTLRQYLDLFEDWDANMAKLAGQITRLLRPSASKRVEPPEPDPDQAQDASWDRVRHGSDPAALEAFLAAYPDGPYVARAQARLEALASVPGDGPGPPPPKGGNRRAWIAIGMLLFFVVLGISSLSPRGEAPPEDAADTPAPAAAGTAAAAGSTGFTPPVSRTAQPGAESVGATDAAPPPPPPRTTPVKPWDGVLLKFKTFTAAMKDGSDLQAFQVVKVDKNSPGARAGLQAGDVILSADGQALDREGAWGSLVNPARPGQVLALKVWRDGKAVDASLALGDLWDDAEHGNVSAMTLLGYTFQVGDDVAVDYAAARGWLDKAAAAGDAEAMLGIGILYANGRGVAKSDTEALKWYAKAANAGDTTAMLMMGHAFITGNAVQADDTKALGWYRKAADAGDPEGAYYAGRMYAAGRGVDEPATTDALYWMRFARAQGEAKAAKWLSDNGFQ